MTTVHIHDADADRVLPSIIKDYDAAIAAMIEDIKKDTPIISFTVFSNFSDYSGYQNIFLSTPNRFFNFVNDEVRIVRGYNSLRHEYKNKAQSHLYRDMLNEEFTHDKELNFAVVKETSCTTPLDKIVLRHIMPYAEKYEFPHVHLIKAGEIPLRF